MDATTAQVFTAIGAALAAISVVAIIKVIRIFLRHIEAADARQEKFLENHMSGHTRAMEASAKANERVADELKDLRNEIHTKIR